MISCVFRGRFCWSCGVARSEAVWCFLVVWSLLVLSLIKTLPRDALNSREYERGPWCFSSGSNLLFVLVRNCGRLRWCAFGFVFPFLFRSARACRGGLCTTVCKSLAHFSFSFLSLLASLHVHFRSLFSCCNRAQTRSRASLSFFFGFPDGSSQKPQLHPSISATTVLYGLVRPDINVKGSPRLNLTKMRIMHTRVTLVYVHYSKYRSTHKPRQLETSCGMTTRFGFVPSARVVHCWGYIWRNQPFSRNQQVCRCRQSGHAGEHTIVKVSQCAYKQRPPPPSPPFPWLWQCMIESWCVSRQLGNLYFRCHHVYPRKGSVFPWEMMAPGRAPCWTPEDHSSSHTWHPSASTIVVVVRPRLLFRVQRATKVVLQ